jgi:microcystin-dependent protein
MAHMKKLAAAPLLIISSLFASSPALAGGGAQPYVGEIVASGRNFCPADWAKADGTLLSIAENDTLFQLYGTTYGGDGQVTFALPNLMGRVHVGAGTGPGLPTRTLGESYGAESATMTTATMPSHAHAGTVKVQDVAGNTAQSVRQRFARTAGNSYSSDAANATLGAGDVVVAATGGSQPFETMQPFLGMTYCVSLFGIFPSPS